MTMLTPSLKIVEIFQSKIGNSCTLPFFDSTIAAGFPSPAEGYIEQYLDLNELIVKHPAATFFVKVEGNSMEDADIRSGDTLVVDRALQPAHGNIVVAILNGEFTVKRLSMGSDGLFLLPENKKFRPLKIEPDADFQVWGVVTYVLHRAK